MSVLATPQIPAGGSRYVEKDGNTKEVDGETGPQSVRRMSQVCNRKISLSSFIIFLTLRFLLLSWRKKPRPYLGKR